MPIATLPGFSECGVTRVYSAHYQGQLYPHCCVDKSSRAQSLRRSCLSLGDFQAQLRAGPNGPHPSFPRCQYPRLRSTRKRNVVAQARGGYTPYPFNTADYYRVTLQVVASSGYGQGTLVLKRVSDAGTQPADTGHALLLQVGGDVLLALAHQVQRQNPRPFSLDLLWQVLERGKEISRRDWKLLHVAIVDLKDMTFIGRLFFGDPETQHIAWDCDCRPSDATWLSLKSHCPFYVKRWVWDAHKTPISEIGLPIPGTEPAKTVSTEPETAQNPLISISESDPEPLKLLKRKMKVAIGEENYRLAAELRDHPYMMQVSRIWEMRQAGRNAEADELSRQLEAEIQEKSGN